MKRKILKILSGAIVFGSLFNVSASAVEPGWHKHTQVSEISCSWEYIYSDGTYASGWQYINGNWYYFDPYDGACYVGECYKTEDGKWAGDPTKSYHDINGERYYFDNNGALMTNTYVYSARGYTYYLDNNGHATMV